MKRLVSILGTGRSGTSLMTRAVMKLGFDAGEKLIPGNHHNPEGYFEDSEVIEIHRILLSRLEGRDMTVTPLPEEWLENPHTETAKKALVELLETRFARSDSVVLKDPRISSLLPMWYDIVDSLGVQLQLIFCARSPAAVAESLKTSAKIPQQVGESIWLSRVMAAAENWEGGFVVQYDDMVADPAAVFGALAKWLGCEFDANELAGLVNESLKHHATDLPVANAFAAEVFHALQKGSSQELLKDQAIILARYGSSLELLDGVVERLRAEELSDQRAGVNNAKRASRRRERARNREVRQASGKHIGSVEVAYRLIEDIAKERSEKLLAEEREAWEARVALLNEEHARELARERDHTLPQIVSQLTEINRQQELEIRKISQQLDAIKAWRSSNESRQQQATQLIGKLDETKASLGQFGQWDDAMVVPAGWLHHVLDRVRAAMVADIDRANPLALLLFGARAIKRGRSIVRRRMLHIHYLIALRSRVRARDAMAIATSGYFDPIYYRSAKQGTSVDPLLNFMNAAQGAKDPSLLFSSRYYLDENPSVENASMNPLVHFVRRGKASGAKPSPVETFGITFGALLSKQKKRGKRLAQPDLATAQAEAELPQTDMPEADEDAPEALTSVSTNEAASKTR